MRHAINFGLLFAFTTLSVTGILAFLYPFSLVTTRVHIVFGVTTAILVGLHLSSRLRYFRAQLQWKRNGDKSRVQPGTLLLIVLMWGALLSAAILNWQPVRTLIGWGYESRHRAEIVRAAPQTVMAQIDEKRQLLIRQSETLAATRLSLLVQFQENLSVKPAMAIWTESLSGTMIETLYLDEALAFSDSPRWNGKITKRNAILPIWRNRYTIVSGVDVGGNIDLLSGATGSHSFSLDAYLNPSTGNEFVIWAEVNVPSDPNASFPDEHLGQPSILYSALVRADPPQVYRILEPTGHGGNAEENGAIQYDLDQLTTARQLVDLMLVKVESAPTEE